MDLKSPGRSLCVQDRTSSGVASVPSTTASSAARVPRTNSERHTASGINQESRCRPGQARDPAHQLRGRGTGPGAKVLNPPALLCQPRQQGQRHHGRFWSSRRGRKCQTRNFHHRSSERRKTNLIVPPGDRFRSQAFSDGTTRPAARPDLSRSHICSDLSGSDTSTPYCWTKSYHTIMKQAESRRGQTRRRTYASPLRISSRVVSH